MSQQMRNGYGFDFPVPVGQSMLVSSITGTYTATIVAGPGKGTALATDSTGGGTYGPYSGGVVIRLQAGANSLIDYDIAVSPALTYAGPLNAGYNSSGDVASALDGVGGSYPIKPIYTLPAPSSMSGTTEIVLAQFAIAAGVLPLLGRLELRLSLSKSGTSETATIKVRAGTLGTTADTLLYTSPSLLTGSNISAGTLLDFKRSSATGLQKLGAGLSTGAYTGASTIAFPAEVTVGNMSDAGYYVSVTASSSAAVETVTLQDLVARITPAV